MSSPKLAYNAPRAQKDAYSKYLSDSTNATCFMFVIMVSETIEALDITNHLKEMFQEQALHERFLTTETLNASNDMIIVQKGKGKAKPKFVGTGLQSLSLK